MKEGEKRELKALYNSYEVVCNKDLVIGPPETKVNKCRYCGKAYSHTEFSNTAHAISESLGNSGILSSDECNECNHFFSNVEQDFITAHKFFLLLEGIKNKDGKNHTLTYGNFKFYDSGEYLTSEITTSELTHIENNIWKSGKFSFTRNLRNSTIRPINVYKALVKFALSIIPIEYTSNFSNTFLWITAKESIFSHYNLPPVIHSVVEPVPHPIICTYIQTTHLYELPFAWATFQFASLKYYFMIPHTEWDCEFYNGAYFKLIFNNVPPKNLTIDNLTSFNPYRIRFDFNAIVENHQI